MTPLEKVARDLRFVMYGVPMDRPMEINSTWLVYARTALKALREPSERMMDAYLDLESVDDDWPYNPPPARTAWQAMIDAALGEEG